MTDNKDTLKVTALKERIGSIVSEYEEHIAELRAQSTVVIQELNEKITQLEAIIQRYNEEKTDNGPVSEDPEATTA